MTTTVVGGRRALVAAPDWGYQPQGHGVHFYEDDAYLLDGLSRFVGAALGAGDAAVVIATPAHRLHLSRLLNTRGIDLGGATTHGRYVALDAESTLASILLDGLPDPGLFAQVVGGVIARATNASVGAPARVAAYGEMVAVLQARGQTDAALRLEELWNDLGAAGAAFDLHCAYPIILFPRAADGQTLTRICNAHARVQPTERYASLLSGVEQARAIAVLQQKAGALETEVAERRQAQLTLERREAELADLLENALEGVQEVNADQVVVWANKALLDLLGYTRAEYVGHPLSRFHADPSVFDAFWRKLTQREDILDFPAVLTCKDGSTKHVLIHSNVLWEGSRFIHTRCFLRDVTETRQMAEALRTIERQKKEFLAAAAHDLRTPLTSIQGLAQLLKRRLARGGSAGVQRAPDMLDGMLAATRKAVRLIDELLDVSRLDATGALELNCDSFDLVDLVRHVLAEQNPTTHKHHLELEAPAAGIVGRWDGARLERAIGNLVSNAIKYSPDGGAVLVRVTEEQDGAERVAVLSVADHGVGIPDADLERVFLRFQRGMNVTGRIDGSGIGLAYAREIAHRHGGTLTVSSEEGRGSVFALRLPLSASSAQPTSG